MQQLSKTIALSRSKIYTSQLSCHVPSVMNGGTQSTYVSNFTKESSHPPKTISKPKVKHLERATTQTQQHRPNVVVVEKHLIDAIKHATNCHAAKKEIKVQSEKDCW